MTNIDKKAHLFSLAVMLELQLLIPGGFSKAFSGVHKNPV